MIGSTADVGEPSDESPFFIDPFKTGNCIRSTVASDGSFHLYHWMSYDSYDEEIDFHFRSYVTRSILYDIFAKKGSKTSMMSDFPACFAL